MNIYYIMDIHNKKIKNLIVCDNVNVYICGCCGFVYVQYHYKKDRISKIDNKIFRENFLIPSRDCRIPSANLDIDLFKLLPNDILNIIFEKYKRYY